MGRYTFRLPDIGEGIAEAEIVAWHVKLGDSIEEDGRLADMMTGKATVEMESPVAGRVVELAGEVGDMVAIGAPLVVLETGNGGGEAEAAAPATLAAPEKRIEAETPEAADVEQVLEAAGVARPTGSERKGSGVQPQQQAEPAAPRSTRSPDPAPAQAETFEARARRSPSATRSGAGRSTISGRADERRRPKVLASPAVRARARELGIDLADVRPAEGGRVRHADLDAFVAYSPSPGYAAAGRSAADEQVRVVGLRRQIAESTAAAKRHIPHFSYVEECDVTELEAARAQLNEHRVLREAQEERPRLTLLPFLAIAVCRAVPQFPMLNASYDDAAGIVTRHGSVHLGIATQTRGGLMVPVIRHAETLNLWQLAREIARLAEAARGGSARPEELSGSTLTVTSLGPLGGIASTPIINRPEVAIIAPNRIVERPMFVPDRIGGERLAKRKLMNLSLSCDHRVIDGFDAASFVQALRRLLEAPALLLAPPIDSAGALP